MNFFRKFIHFWITLTSLIGFLAGWAYLAQAGRQVQEQTAGSTGLETGLNLPPLPTVDNLLGTVSSIPGVAQTYRINPVTPTPLPPPPSQPKALFFTPKLRTKSS